ncbi:MAG: TIGR00282 family metallophosphoesterase [Beijerinckiaceae bacterium]|nr:TIGR00282 family metallophosphoesterase [Beijerinckiaceae bacterium]
MRILFLGDIVGRPGREAFIREVPALRERWNLDCVIVNAENSAGGFGITEVIYHELVDAGADAITLGNHSWDQREALVFIERAERLIRPLNFPRGTPGRGAAMVETRGGQHVLVVNAMGRLYMDAIDDPFTALEREVAACKLGEAADAIVIDFHAEATSEKQAIGRMLDGRVSLVVGTHTHAPTADHQIFAGGTAYQSDAGMSGNYDSILGMDKQEPIRRWIEKTPGSRMEVAEGPATLCGLAVETDDRTGLAKRIAPVRIGGVLSEARPAMWE